ncbi:hypothetical protein ACJJTC_010153 [Scirpophaga incertulas]
MFVIIYKLADDVCIVEMSYSTFEVQNICYGRQKQELYSPKKNDGISVSRQRKDEIKMQAELSEKIKIEEINGDITPPYLREPDGKRPMSVTGDLSSGIPSNPSDLLDVFYSETQPNKLFSKYAGWVFFSRALLDVFRLNATDRE